MSIKVIQWVWDCSSSRNAERLVLLAIADNAADDGSHAYPSIAEICRKANLSERGVQAAIARLVTAGELRVDVGGGRGHTNYYTVIIKPCGRNTPQNLRPSGPTRGGETPQSSTANPAESAGNPADSAPGTVLEPSLEPSSSSDAAASPNAGLIIKGFIDWLAARPEPVKLTPSVIARYGKAIKALLQANYDVDTIKRALALQTERGKAGWPSMLDSFCVEVQNRPTSGAPAGASKPFVQQAAEFKASQQQRDDAVISLMSQLIEYAESEHGEKLTAPAARKLVNGWIDSGQIDLNGLNTSVPSLYSGGNAITVDAEEVS